MKVDTKAKAALFRLVYIVLCGALVTAALAAAQGHADLAVLGTAAVTGALGGVIEWLTWVEKADPDLAEAIDAPVAAEVVKEAHAEVTAKGAALVAASAPAVPAAPEAPKAA